MNTVRSSGTAEKVVLVNENDEEVGTMDKLEAHHQGALHRAFSIFLFDHEGRLLLQRRALGKYHSGGLWTNTCCSHPRPGETIEHAAGRRLREEMGMTAELEHRFTFIYKADVGQGLIEHELDHVLFGRSTGDPLPDPNEVVEWRYVDIQDLQRELSAGPEHFTAWLHRCWPLVLEQLHEQRA
jgi:isopentenyl-diphosphate delta-isomerase